jgi:hypothetical protein
VTEQRKLQRRDLISYLRVYGEDPGKPIGHLVDITTEGIMLISEDPIETGRVFRLRMVLPAEIDGKREVLLTAESRWCSEDENPAFYDTGFRLTEFSPEQTKIIEHLIQNYCFKESLGQL